MERDAEQLVHLRENGDARREDARARAVDAETLGDRAGIQGLDETQRLGELGVAEPWTDEPARRPRAAADRERELGRRRSERRQRLRSLRARVLEILRARRQAN